MWVNNLPKVATQWNSGATRDSNPGHRARIPSVPTTKPLRHTSCLCRRLLIVCFSRCPCLCVCVRVCMSLCLSVCLFVCLCRHLLIACLAGCPGVCHCLWLHQRSEVSTLLYSPQPGEWVAHVSFYMTNTEITCALDKMRYLLECSREWLK